MVSDKLLYDLVELFYEAIPEDRYPYSGRLLEAVEVLDEISVQKLGLYQAKPKLGLISAELHLAVRRREVPADLVPVYTALRDTVRAVHRGYLTVCDFADVKSCLAEVLNGLH